VLFKQLSVYQMDLTAWSFDDSYAKLAEARFMPAIASAWHSEGWVPLDGSDDFMQINQDCCWFSFCQEEKILPAMVIREALAERIADIESKEARSLGKKEIRALKDELALMLLPKAFRKKKKTLAFVDLKRQLLMVNAIGSTADAVIGLLTKSWPHLQLSLAKPQKMLSDELTQALLDGVLPDPFAFDMDCEMKDSGSDGALVRCRKMSLYAPELQYHLAAGKKVTQIGLVWDDKLHFLLTDDGLIKRFKFKEGEHADDPAADTDEAQWIADCLLTQSSMRSFYHDLAYAFLNKPT
jgi:recombination associated protein RdgC